MIISQGHGRRLQSVLLSAIDKIFMPNLSHGGNRCCVAPPRAASVNEARCSNELLEHLEHLHETNDLFGNVAKSQNLRICGQMGLELCSKWWRWQRRAGPAGIYLPMPVPLSTFQTGCFLSFFCGSRGWSLLRSAFLMQEAQSLQDSSTLISHNAGFWPTCERQTNSELSTTLRRTN
jgi:hypothetical protein